MKVLKYKYNPNKKGVFRVSIVKNPAVGEGDLVLMNTVDFKVGDSVMVKEGMEHMPEHKGMIFTIAEIAGNSIALKQPDGSIHKWYVGDELVKNVVEMASQEIKGVFYSPVMIPDVKITRIDPKTGEKYLVYYDAETVEQLANNYFKQNGNSNTNIEHNAQGIEGVYPVESWIVQDPDNDKSKAIGMPTQKQGTWIMGYKCDSPEILQQIKEQLLQGLSIEGLLDTEEDTDNPIAKFNKHKVMSKPLLEALTDLKAVIMSAISGEEKPVEEVPAEIETPEEEKKDVEEMAVETPQIDVQTAPTVEDLQKEIETLKATNDELQAKCDSMEAELATYKNDATLMSAQLEEVQTAFENYKTVKMSSQKIGDTPKVEVVMSALEKKQAKFLEETKSKLN